MNHQIASIYLISFLYFVAHDGLADIAHKVIHVLNVVDARQRMKERLLRLAEVVQVGHVVVPAGRAGALPTNGLTKRPRILGVFEVYAPASTAAEDGAVASDAGGKAAGRMTPDDKRSRRRCNIQFFSQ